MPESGSQSAPASCSHRPIDLQRGSALYSWWAPCGHHCHHAAQAESRAGGVCAPMRGSTVSDSVFHPPHMAGQCVSPALVAGPVCSGRRCRPAGREVNPQQALRNLDRPTMPRNIDAALQLGCRMQSISASDAAVSCTILASPCWQRRWRCCS